eukprot:1366533-Karenia_brevis.AAC.1
MYSMGANPRTLADDLLVNSSGSRALHVFQAAFEATITHLLDLGGKLSAHKSKVYATLSSHRSWLSTYQWQGLQQLIPVVHCLRDLGSALNTTLSINTSLSQNRFQKASHTLSKIGKLPHNKRAKAKFAR